MIMIAPLFIKILGILIHHNDLVLPAVGGSPPNKSKNRPSSQIFLIPAYSIIFILVSNVNRGGEADA